MIGRAPGGKVKGGGEKGVWYIWRALSCLCFCEASARSIYPAFCRLLRLVLLLAVYDQEPRSDTDCSAEEQRADGTEWRRAAIGRLEGSAVRSSASAASDQV
eukprot:scaffold24328_cov107-Isochrysis_galbana.AAC.1